MSGLDFLNEGSAERQQRKEAFKVPEGYFEGLTERVMARVQAEETPIQEGARTKIKRVNIRELYPRLKPYVYLAAMIAGLAFGVRVIKYQQQYFETPTEVVSSIDEKALDAYVDDYCNYFGVDDSDILALISEEDY